MNIFRRASLFSALFLLAFIGFLSCKKINEATELGGDLIPIVDNINTFELNLNPAANNVASYAPSSDTTNMVYGDATAIGSLTDPEFGATTANGYFNLSLSSYGTYPFKNTDRSTITLDSVVLSLGYLGAYGDTNATQTVRVFEVADQANGLNDTTYYRFNRDDFTTTGAQLGAKTFTLSSLKDSIIMKRSSTDSQKVANQLRIRLSNSLGQRFINYDTIQTSASGAFYNDSAFKKFFRGLTIKADAGGSALGYYNVFDNTNTRLTVYYRVVTNGVIDTASVYFAHNTVAYTTFTHPGGVANTVKRTPGGGWAAYLANTTTNDDKIYLQSAPGSYATINIPELSTLSNRTIQLAELIFYRIPSASQDIYTPPGRIFLDRINATKDTAFAFERDALYNSSTGTSDLTTFGGLFKTDNTYRFNITRAVQNIITRKEPNYTLRLSAPLDARVYDKTVGSFLSVPVSSAIARGRVVLAGGNYAADPSLRMRLRIVYSNL